MIDALENKKDKSFAPFNAPYKQIEVKSEEISLSSD